jgi:hypothetical protein
MDRRTCTFKIVDFASPLAYLLDLSVFGKLLISDDMAWSKADSASKAAPDAVEVRGFMFS